MTGSSHYPQLEVCLTHLHLKAHVAQTFDPAPLSNQEAGWTPSSHELTDRGGIGASSVLELDQSLLFMCCFMLR